MKIVWQVNSSQAQCYSFLLLGVGRFVITCTVVQRILICYWNVMNVAHSILWILFSFYTLCCGLSTSRGSHTVILSPATSFYVGVGWIFPAKHLTSVPQEFENMSLNLRAIYCGEAKSCLSFIASHLNAITHCCAAFPCIQIFHFKHIQWGMYCQLWQANVHLPALNIKHYTFNMYTITPMMCMHLLLCKNHQSLSMHNHSSTLHPDRSLLICSTFQLPDHHY